MPTFVGTRGRVGVARSRQREVRPDILGAVGALPFVAVSVILLLFGLIALLFAVLTFNGGRIVDALQRMGFGAFFLLLAAGTIAASRAASEPERPL